MDPKFTVELSGKVYPLYAGVLSEAHERGLAGIETEIIQIPAEENGQTAIVKATVRMKDGSVFSEFGDASPRNTSARIATALLRMALTRAKGRALRDAVNIGQTLLEELGDLEQEAPVRYGARPTADSPVPSSRPAVRHELGFEETYTEDGKPYRRVDLVGYALRAMEQAIEQGIKFEAIEPTRATNPALVAFGRMMRPKLSVMAAHAEGAQGQAEAKRGNVAVAK